MYNLRNIRVNRHCSTETSCHVQDLGRESCSKNELQSPLASDGRNVTPSRATATTCLITCEDPNSNSPQPSIDVTRATHVACDHKSRTVNSFINRYYYKITNQETLKQSNQCRAITKNNLLSEFLLQQIWREVLLEMPIQGGDSEAEASESVINGQYPLDNIVQGNLNLTLVTNSDYDSSNPTRRPNLGPTETQIIYFRVSSLLW